MARGDSSSSSKAQKKPAATIAKHSLDKPAKEKRTRRTRVGLKAALSIIDQQQLVTDQVQRAPFSREVRRMMSKLGERGYAKLAFGTHIGTDGTTPNMSRESLDALLTGLQGAGVRLMERAGLIALAGGCIQISGKHVVAAALTLPEFAGAVQEGNALHSVLFLGTDATTGDKSDDTPLSSVPRTNRRAHVYCKM